MKVNVGTLSAEFPNDNPALHGGARWVCLDVRGPASVVLPEARRAPVPDRESGIVAAGTVAQDDASLASLLAQVLDADDGEDDGEAFIVEELPPLEEAVSIEEVREPRADLTLAPLAKAKTTIAPPAPDDAWTTFTSTLAGIVIGQGAPHVAATVASLLTHGLAEGLSAEISRSLIEARILGDGGVVTREFLARTNAWRGILRGTSDDFAACGDVMLDDFAADLLARLLGQPARAPQLKRELRERGVAAFGLLDAA